MIIERWSIIAADMNERMSEAERVNPQTLPHADAHGGVNTKQLKLPTPKIGVNP